MACLYIRALQDVRDKQERFTNEVKIGLLSAGVPFSELFTDEVRDDEASAEALVDPTIDDGRPVTWKFEYPDDFDPEAAERELDAFLAAASEDGHASGQDFIDWGTP